MVVQTSSQATIPSDNHSKPKRTFSDVIVDYLKLFEVEYVFGVPGAHISSFYEALARSERKGGPRAILSCHETGGAYMANGYARETGKIGVCCATAGPGATNLITGVAAAYVDYTPLLVITAQTLSFRFGQGAFQESSPDNIDVTAMFKHCTRYSTVVTTPKLLEQKLAAAFTAALQSPQGPAHISIPIDLFNSPAPDSVSYPNLSQLLVNPSSNLDLTALETLCQILYDVLSQDRKVVLLVGRDSAGAAQEIMAFAELIHANVVTSPTGKPWVNPYHPLARGVFGFVGHETARQAVTDDTVDLILAVGTELGQGSTSGWDSAVLNHKLVHIHHSNASFTRSPMARLHVHGTIKTIFEKLATDIDTMQRNGKLRLPTPLTPSFSESHRELPCHPSQIAVKKPESYQLVDSSAPIKPQRLICKLVQDFPPETRFLSDVGNWMAWTIHYFFSKHPENYSFSIRTGAMGWAIGNAIGTAFGVPNTPVVCLTGDGSIIMNGQEITVAVAKQLTVVFVILNDSSYGMVKYRHQQTGTETLEFALPPVDFSLMAKAMGAKGYTIRQTEDFEKLDLQAIYTYPGPTVLDVYIDKEEVPPIGMW